jgi:adenosine deaminase
VLVNAGIKMCISSNSLAYMDSSWVLHNLLVTKRMCNLSNGDILSITKVSIEMSWAMDEVKVGLLEKPDVFGRTRIS